MAATRRSLGAGRYQLQVCAAPSQRQFGFWADAFDITRDLVDTSSLWQTDWLIESFERLEFQFARERAEMAKKRAATKGQRLQRDKVR